MDLLKVQQQQVNICVGWWGKVLEHGSAIYVHPMIKWNKCVHVNKYLLLINLRERLMSVMNRYEGAISSY